ncbi:YjjG family noncanonical pyrimidine nucleotidase [Streptococcus plurextorum]|uniref:YjjG family noncanonical pyrimidine nucleotidase n=1 Tax=Streptococcus plurextorum TaxID=456876 RepID=UPI0004292088|nr:YjjG family noncanonical pyrimidine nucleotidase [Streptococcus plurextorum]
MHYKFLLFDLDHTLLDFELAEDMALTFLLEEAGVSEIQAYKDYYVPMNAALWRQLERGEISKSELIATRFSRVFDHFGQERDGEHLALRYQHFLSQQGQTFSGARELLEELKARGYRLFGATNGVTLIQEGRLEQSAIGHLFERVFISEQIGTAKPDRAYYDWIASEIDGFDQKAALMIGDSLTADIQGGNQSGIDTVWFNPEEKPNNSSAIPTYQVNSYAELLELL